MRWHRPSTRELALAGFLVCMGLVSFALYLQYVEHVEPCPLCMLQRVTFVALGLAFLAAAIPRNNRLVIRFSALAGLALAITGIGLATRHVWLQWNPPQFEAC